MISNFIQSPRQKFISDQKQHKISSTQSTQNVCLILTHHYFPGQLFSTPLS